jgi:hypothetical protein
VKPIKRVSLLAGGYVVCFLIASAAVAIRASSASGQASSGMYGFGDALLFLGVFGLLALVPTGIGLYFLRPYPGFWKLLATAGIGIAATGVTAVIVYSIGRHELATPLATWAGVSVIRIIVSPLLVLSFLVCGCLSPHRPSRFAFLTATLLEAVVSAYGGTFWFIHVVLHRP